SGWPASITCTGASGGFGRSTGSPAPGRPSCWPPASNTGRPGTRIRSTAHECSRSGAGYADLVETSGATPRSDGERQVANDAAEPAPMDGDQFSGPDDGAAQTGWQAAGEA